MTLHLDHHALYPICTSQLVLSPTVSKPTKFNKCENYVYADLLYRHGWLHKSAVKSVKETRFHALFFFSTALGMYSP